jgi:hypothetical protein
MTGDRRNTAQSCLDRGDDAPLCGEGIYPRSAAQQSQTNRRGLPDAPQCLLGLPRNPAGINPLATTGFTLQDAQR